MVQRDGARKVTEDHNMKEHKINAVLHTDLWKKTFQNVECSKVHSFSLTGDSFTTSPERKLKQ